MFEYNGYLFYENIAWLMDRLEITDYSLPINVEDYPQLKNNISLAGKSFRYPDQTVYFAHNDEKCILIFAYVVNYSSSRLNDLEMMEDNCKWFLDEYFPYYDFDA